MTSMPLTYSPIQFLQNCKASFRVPTQASKVNRQIGVQVIEIDVLTSSRSEKIVLSHLFDFAGVFFSLALEAQPSGVFEPPLECRPQRLALHLVWGIEHGFDGSLVLLDRSFLRFLVTLPLT